MLLRFSFRTLMFASTLAAGVQAAHATGMSVTSSAFEDGGAIPARFAGPAACGGDNVSLPVAWHDLPAGTRSVVVTLTDPNGPKGLGVTHWIAYGIAPDAGSLDAGATLAPPAVQGQNMTGAAQYRGPCPPVGDIAHHYLLTVTATDVTPGALPPGLDLHTLETRLTGHTLSGASIVGRYAR
jgi:Raf kinase inhibitor-like YbhB/YbcL family protein